jgi:hypothetical protein
MMIVFLPGFQKGRVQFRQKKAICVVARKNVKKLEKHIEFRLLGSIKCFSISFTHLRQFRWLPDGAGIIMTITKNLE